MNQFKFFRDNAPIRVVSRSWYGNYYRGRLQWMYRPLGVIFYNEMTEQNGIYDSDIKSVSVQVTSRYMYSYNEFMETHRDKIIFAYEFVDNANISNMIHYNHENFDDMPRDRPLIFRGIIRSHEVF